MTDDALVKKIKWNITRNETKLQKQVNEIGRIWEDTGLDPKDPSYLVEKTMRFEMAQEAVNSAFLLFDQTISEYKKLCFELEKSDNS